jgi:hypothetical protein
VIPQYPPPKTAHEAVFHCLLEQPMTQPIVAELAARLNADMSEAWHERAAIMEFDGGLPRDLAEALALLVLIRQYPQQVLACLL